MTASRVLVVDDEVGLARALSITLRAVGWDVRPAGWCSATARRCG